MLETDDLVLFDAQKERWLAPNVDFTCHVQQQAGSSSTQQRPSPRNAAAMVPLCVKVAGSTGGDSSSSTQAGAAVAAAEAGSVVASSAVAEGRVQSKFLLQGGWRAFVESYASTHIFTVNIC